MNNILVLAEHSEGAVTAFTEELLAAAARLGTPAAVVVGAPGTAETLAPELGKLGAATVYAAQSADAARYLLTPQVAGLHAAAQAAAPAAILIASSVDGREIAGRLAVRLNSGVITDAVDITRTDDDAIVATQSVFGGSYTVQSNVSQGIPIITVRRNSVEGAAEPAAGALVELDLRDRSGNLGDGTGRASRTGGGSAGVDGGIDRGVRWPGCGFSRELRSGRGTRRFPRRRDGCVPGGGRLGVLPGAVPGRADGDHRFAAVVHRAGHFRGHSTSGRHADLEDDRRGQQGR